MPRIGTLARLEVKMIGKPYALVGQVRFDEGRLDFYLWTILTGTKLETPIQPRVTPKDHGACPVLYPEIRRKSGQNIKNAQ
jgi:hypothetical protein